MRYLLIVMGILLLSGCASKPVKQNPSYELQHQNAQKEWKSLDNN